MNVLNVIVGKSAIHGNGLFAAKDIPSGEIICEYTGDHMNVQDDKSNHDYTYHLGDMVIVGTGDARYINDNVDFRPLTYAETEAFFMQKKLPVICAHNCEFVISGARVFVKSISDIRSGDELFICYGFKYWFVRFIKIGYIDRNYDIKYISV